MHCNAGSFSVLGPTDVPPREHPRPCTGALVLSERAHPRDEGHKEECPAVQKGRIRPTFGYRLSKTWKPIDLVASVREHVPEITQM